MLREARDAVQLENILAPLRLRNRSIGLVPTMGALHAGHLELLRRCRAENRVVVMSLYVNPAQFGPTEDFARYPRDFARDRRLAEEADCDILFAPSDEVMYPRGFEHRHIWVDPGDLGRQLEGESRPGHFRGVATVVHNLFVMARPHRAYFGQKDLQQVQIVKHMVEDLSLNVNVVTVPTVREPDGLALSSRNVYLDPAQRLEAAALSRALDSALAEWQRGVREAAALEAAATRTLTARASSGNVDYTKVASLDTLRPLVGAVSEPAFIALAVRFGGTRLIDNELLLA